MRHRLTSSTSSQRVLLSFLLHIAARRPSVDSFSPSRPIDATSRRTALPPRPLSNIIDAEVIPNDDLDDSGASGSVAVPDLNLVEYSQNQDPDWRTMPVAFCDADANTYIDCHLAFYAKDPQGDDSHGAGYALGVPCEVPVVVAIEVGDGNAGGDDDGDAASSVINLSRVIPLSPDDDGEGSGVLPDEEREEVFQMAARALRDEFGPDVRLKKTPRVLTLEGDIDGAIGDWKKVLLGGATGKKDKMSFEEALEAYDDDDEDEEDYFDKIMRRDLGEDYMKLVEDDDDDSMDEELLKMFDSEGLDSDLDELMKDVAAKESTIADGTYDELVKQLQPSAALKILSFVGPGEKEYSILRPLRPILLVGKEDPDDYTRRILLTDEERRRILPRLEGACRAGLEEAGFFLAGSGDEN